MMRRGISAFPLKCVAILAMLANHMGSGLGWENTHPALFLCTETVGKLTFPIMAFLLVEGFRHTRNVKQYALRLAGFWLVSILPFWLWFNAPRRPFLALDLVNNIFFTLLSGLLMLVVIRRQPRGRVLVVLGFSLLTAASDWALLGVWMIFGFYALEDRKLRATLPVLYTMAGYMLLLWGAGRPDLLLTFLGMLGAIVLLMWYNGERGYSPAFVKWGFYAFYPVHFLVLWAVRMLL